MEINKHGILIVAGPRTGGTNLAKAISMYYNKNFIFEPDINNIDFDIKNKLMSNKKIL